MIFDFTGMLAPIEGKYKSFPILGMDPAPRRLRRYFSSPSGSPGFPGFPVQSRPWVAANDEAVHRRPCALEGPSLEGAEFQGQTGEEVVIFGTRSSTLRLGRMNNTRTP